MKRKKQLKPDSQWLPITLLLLLHFCIAIHSESRVVRVGLFPAAPLVFEKNGKPQGLFIDLLECFANKNQWRIKYINGTWDQLQAQLLKGDIDLLPAIGYSKERAHLFDFNNNPVFVENGVLFTSPKFKIHTIFDLDNKRVAGVTGSIFTTGFTDYINSFGILCEIIHTKDNQEVMETILAGKADAGICVYSLGNELAKKYPVAITPISFSPIALHYAVCKGTNADLLLGIDTLISTMVRDPNSEYSVLYTNYIESVRLQNIPIWLTWGLIGLFCIGGVFAIWSFSLNRLVKLRTMHLNKEITERKLIADDLQANRERLVLATRSAHIGIWDWNILTNELIWDEQMYQIYGIFQKPVSIGVDENPVQALMVKLFQIGIFCPVCCN